MVDGWEPSAVGLTRTFSFRDFSGVKTFVTEVMTLAEKKHHHPTLIFGFSKVSVTYITHDRGKTVTDLDIDSAEILNNIYETI